jgi:hypothetical protein
MLSADGAVITISEGGVSFCGKYSCPWCMVTKERLGVEKEFPPRREQVLSNPGYREPTGST